MSMQALYLADGKLQFQIDAPKPQPKKGEALIRLQLAGICSTDLEIVKGYAGFAGILGHEFVGDVVEAPDEPTWVGKRVVGRINLGCRSCPDCFAGNVEHCPHRTVLGIINKDGAFADYLTLPTANLLEVPEGVTDEEAVFTEPLAAALRIRQQAKISPTDKVAVVGPGRLGLLIGQVLALGGASVMMLGRSRKSLEMPEQMGMQTGIISDYADNAFDFVVEATGNEAGFAHSLRLVRPLGRLALKSTFAGKAHIDLTKLVVGEITVIGSRCGPFHPALRLLAEKAIQTAPLIQGRYPLSQGIPAFAHAAQPGVRKILLQP